MANCKVQYGINNVCGDLIFPGGADKDFYVGYTTDLGTPISLTQSAAISSLSFVAYTGLVKFEGMKFANNFTWELGVGPGSNIWYTQKAIVKVIALSTQDDVEVQRLSQAQNAFIVFRNNNDQFFVMGANKGLKAIAGPLGATGVQMGDDVATTITLEGAEKTIPIRFDAGSVSATVALLDGYIR